MVAGADTPANGGGGGQGDIEKLLDLCDNISAGPSALGDGATSPITSAIQLLPDEFEAAMHTPAWELPVRAQHDLRSRARRSMSMSVTATGSSASAAVEQREDLVTLTIDDVEVGAEGHPGDSRR